MVKRVNNGEASTPKLKMVKKIEIKIQGDFMSSGGANTPDSLFYGTPSS
jgi:hypothetical protein